MQKTELSRLPYLKKDIEREIRQLQALEEAEGPHMAGESDITDLKPMIAEHLRQSIQEYAALCQYMNRIPDQVMRSIVYYRHIKDMSWTEIAMRIGGGNTPDGIRRAHDRYLAKAK